MMQRRSLSTSAAVLLGGGLAAALLGGSGGRERQAQAQALTAPSPKKVFNARLPVFEQLTLPSGLTVYSYQDDTLPVVSLALAVRSGSGAESAGKAGLAQLAYRVLASRSDSPEASTGAPAVSELGAHLEWEVEADGGRLQLNVLASQAERAVAALAALVQPPTVSARDLQRLKAEQLASQSASRGLPTFLAEDQLRQLIYGPQHPYGHLAAGTPATVNPITAQDIATYHGCTLFPKNVALIAAGRVTSAAVRDWAARYLGTWQASGQSCQQAVLLPTATKRTQVVAIARPGLAQTLIMVGRAMVPLGHPHEQALQLADSYLKALSFYQLRLQKGITYGVSGQLTHNLHGGHFSLSTQVQADQTGEALSELLSQMFAIQHESVPTRFVINARLRHGWGIVSEYATLPSSVHHVAQLFHWLQPLTSDQTRLMQLQQIGAADVDAAASRYFNRSLMQIVVVGDPDIIKAQVGTQNLGALHFTADCVQAGACD